MAEEPKDEEALVNLQDKTVIYILPFPKNYIIYIKLTKKVIYI